MNPTRIVSLAIGMVALIGVMAIALMGGRVGGSPQPTAEQAAAAAIAEGARQGAKTVAVADQAEAEDPWAVDDSWSEAEDEPVDEDDSSGAQAPAQPVSAPVPAVPEPPSSSDRNPPVAVVLR